MACGRFGRRKTYIHTSGRQALMKHAGTCGTVAEPQCGSVRGGAQHDPPDGQLQRRARNLLDGTVGKVDFHANGCARLQGRRTQQECPAAGNVSGCPGHPAFLHENAHRGVESVAFGSASIRGAMTHGTSIHVRPALVWKQPGYGCARVCAVVRGVLPCMGKNIPARSRADNQAMV